VKQLLIADEHEVVRSGLRAIIGTRADWVVCGEAADGRDTVALALKLKPDIAIVDYSMPVMSGLEVSRRVKIASIGHRPSLSQCVKVKKF